MGNETCWTCHSNLTNVSFQMQTPTSLAKFRSKSTESLNNNAGTFSDVFQDDTYTDSYISTIGVDFVSDSI